MNSFGSFLSFGLLALAVSGSARADDGEYESMGNPDIKCEAVKKTNPETRREMRGISIYHQSIVRTAKGKATPSEKRYIHTLYFGESVSIRNQALVACEKGRAILECRHDGPTRYSYFSSATTTDWALHGPKILETFSEPKIWGESGYMQCQRRIIELISGQIQQLQ